MISIDNENLTQATMIITTGSRPLRNLYMASNLRIVEDFNIVESFGKDQDLVKVKELDTAYDPQ